MPNYKETQVSGESYQRSHRIIVENKRGDTPHITFLEEQVINLGTDVRGFEVGGVTVYFDPAREFQLVNPLDDSPLGQSASHLQFQIMLYSLYKQATADRDTAALMESARLAEEARTAQEAIADNSTTGGQDPG